MYKPEDRLHPQYPVFNKINGHVISWLPARAMIATVIFLIIGILFASFLGIFTHHADVKLTSAEKQEELIQMKAARAQVQLDEINDAIVPYLTSDGAKKTDLSSAEEVEYQQLTSKRSSAQAQLFSSETLDREASLALAYDRGITSDTEDLELMSLIPETYDKEVESFNGFARFTVVVFITAIGLILFSEMMGSAALIDLIIQRIQYCKKNHIFIYQQSNSYGIKELDYAD